VNNGFGDELLRWRRLLWRHVGHGDGGHVGGDIAKTLEERLVLVRL